MLFHSAIAAQDPDDPFDIDDVARTLTEKMVRRHPHVFAGEVAARRRCRCWCTGTREGGGEKRTRRSVLDGVPRGMPALALAQKLAGRAAGVGVAVESAAAPASEDELGEALLALVATARAQGWDAERALRERLRVLEDDVRAAEAAS